MKRRADGGEKLLQLESGRILWLDDADKVWRVRAGEADVFAVTGVDSRHYRQVFLGQAGEGRLLFGLAPAAGAGLMVTATRGATLGCMSRASLLEEAGGQPTETLLAMIEGWLMTLLAGPEILAAPRAFLSLAPGETVSPAAGQSVRAGEAGLTWARVVSGAVSYGPGADFDLPPGMEVPLEGQAWLTAKNEAVLQGLATLEVFPPAGRGNPADFWRPLDRCHQLFASIMADRFAAEAGRDSERLEAKRQLRERLLHSAASHLLRTDLADLPPVMAIGAPDSPLLMAVQAVAAHLGVPEEQVRLPAGADPQRQDVTLLRSIVRLAGMQVRQVTLEPGWQQRDNGPLIGFFAAERRPVALVPLAPGKYHLFDPDTAATTIVDEETARLVDPIAYTVYAGLPGKSLSLSGLLRFIIGKCWPGDLWSIVIVSMIAGIIPVLTPLVTQTIFEDIIPIYDRQGLVMVVQVMIVAAFATTGVAFARGVTFLRLKGKSLLVVEAALWLRLLSLPAVFFRRHEAGDLVQRMTGIGHLTMLLSNSVISALFNTLFSFFSLLVMLYYSWQLTLAAAAVWVVYLGLAAFLAWRMIVSKRRLMAATGETASQVLQIFNGLSKFRMQGAEAQAFYLWARPFGEQWKWNRAFRWRSNLLELVNAVQPVLLTMLVFWLTMRWLDAGEAGGQATFLTLPQFMGFNAALTGFNATVTGMITVVTGLMEIVPQLERLRPILETEPEVTDDKVEVGELSGRIEISRVSFRYGHELPEVLRDVSINVRPGQFVAVVGSSGSGKSTLLRLLLGFEKPEKGSIYYDGQDLADLHVASVRAQLGVVLQNGQLMASDILSNITGSLPLTVDDAWAAAEMVGLADDIRAMPMGMHTLISEGATNISGGQRQRILIARAIVHRPRIIMFDEATSALDNRTQAIVTESLDRLKATRIVVAHRLSTVMNADVIYVMDKGEIVESGCYEDLMANGGLFAALARRQMA